jgi:NADP-dependent 3-hydroxy acid dehydrogenase YdfG
LNDQGTSHNAEHRGKVVVITGASSGLGEATAQHFAAAGAKLVLGARRLDRLQALAGELGLGTDAAMQTDVTDREQVKALVDHAVTMHGHLDVIVNNAGLMPHSLASLRHHRRSIPPPLVDDAYGRFFDRHVQSGIVFHAALLP